jgi:hypothetical protein
VLPLASGRIMALYEDLLVPPDAIAAMGLFALCSFPGRRQAGTTRPPAHSLSRDDRYRCHAPTPCASLWGRRIPYVSRRMRSAVVCMRSWCVICSEPTRASEAVTESVAAIARAMPRAICPHCLPRGDSYFVFIALGWRSFVVFGVQPDSQQP